MRWKFENRRISTDCSNFTFLLIIIISNSIYKLILTTFCKFFQAKISHASPKKHTIRWIHHRRTEYNRSLRSQPYDSILIRYAERARSHCWSETKRGTSTLSSSRTFNLNTHTYTYALILQNYLKEGVALRASNLLNLLLFGQVTRHREVVEYILIFHFLWIYSAYRVLPRCLANDDDGPPRSSRGTSTILRGPVPRGNDYTNRWFIILVFVRFVLESRKKGKKRKVSRRVTLLFLKKRLIFIWISIDFDRLVSHLWMKIGRKD